jgi:hypothetical protein
LVSMIVLLVISFSMVLFYLNDCVQAQGFIMESEHYKTIIFNITPG